MPLLSLFFSLLLFLLKANQSLMSACYELTICPIITEAPETSDMMLGGGAVGR